MEKKKRGLSASFITGAIAFVFIIVGYQTALFINKAAVAKVLADQSAPDTVYVNTPAWEASADGGGGYNGGNGYGQGGNGIYGGSNGNGSYRNGNYRNGNYNSSGRSGNNGGRSGNHTTGGKNKAAVAPEAGFEQSYEAATKPPVENFNFNPNTVSVEDLQRLGFSPKQAAAIDNYRAKGGRYRRKSDFAKSFVVSDSVYRRLEPYIVIPRVELNSADSAAFDDLPGIGGYFAKEMVKYRRQLGGYSYKEQLLDIYRFDEEKFAGLEDLIEVDTTLVRPYPLWTLPEDSLILHPYIGKYSAHGIVVYRQNNDAKDLTVEGLGKAGILRAGMAEKLARCRLAPPLQ